MGRRYAQGTHTACFVNDVLHEGALGRLAVRLKDALAHSQPAQLVHNPTYWDERALLWNI